MDFKGKYDTQPKYTRDFKCFRCQGLGHYTLECPNKKIMVMKGNGDVEFKSDKSDCEDMLPLKDCIEDELTLHVEVSLVIRCILQVQVKEDDSDQQRENIFHTRCYVLNKICSLIIYSGSYTNMSSTILFCKLNLCIVKHTRLYRLQWLNDNGEVKVTKQVVVLFSIGKYMDEFLCNVVGLGLFNKKLVFRIIR